MSRRVFLILMLLALGLLLSVLFRDFVQENAVTPVAVLFVLGWRIVLSIDQEYYWGTLILAASLYALTRPQARPPANLEPPQTPSAQIALENMNHWRTSLLSPHTEIDKTNILQNNLRHMLTRLYASKQPEVVQYEIVAALQQRQIPLPEHIYTFLFPPALPTSRRTFRQALQTLSRLPQTWLRRQTGRAAAEYYQSIEQVLTFMEASLEIKHADE